MALVIFDRCAICQQTVGAVFNSGCRSQSRLETAPTMVWVLSHNLPLNISTAIQSPRTILTCQAGVS